MKCPAGDVPVLEAVGVSQEFVGKSSTGHRTRIRAIRDVSLRLFRRQIIAVVGESGSGKTTLARLFSLLYRPTRGEIRFQGEPVRRDRRGRAAYYAEVQMIFQDPFGSLNHLKTLRHIIGRAVRLHTGARTRSDVITRVHEALEKVSLTPPDDYAQRYPSDLSGGQRQRVAIARALAMNPAVLLADEPTSMLDASIRLDVLNLLADLRDQEDLAMLYITHDIASARYLSDVIAVMYAGEIVEQAPTEELIAEPLHPYTWLLLQSAPNPQHYKGNQSIGSGDEEDSEETEPVDVAVDLPGCRFATRCPRAMNLCADERPPLVDVGGRSVACWLHLTDDARPNRTKIEI
ncbi:ABC transporter ATP-binding protein [Microlunatus parietis]|uniref:Peptide/nickel transport system ATP-binding protein n=1 Tax=Microlunatus parietis TaxID=682979 RepID=A0A7Y9IDU1_9ACTN|nr:ABC transporter ATP-binding protein [Microlunatus parietis]NYE74693.1 peptide/nickel transport system ATP-binding protein [Microlunatus parietis]